MNDMRKYITIIETQQESLTNIDDQKLLDHIHSIGVHKFIRTLNGPIPEHIQCLLVQEDPVVYSSLIEYQQQPGIAVQKIVLNEEPFWFLNVSCERDYPISLMVQWLAARHCLEKVNNSPLLKNNTFNQVHFEIVNGKINSKVRSFLISNSLMGSW